MPPVLEYQKVFLYTKSCVAPLLPSFLFSSLYTKVIDVLILNLYMISRDLADVSELWRIWKASEDSLSYGMLCPDWLFGCIVG